LTALLEMANPVPPGLAATPAFGGDCFTGSFAVHNAYRCIDRHFVRDA